jgi:hypothetical protein
MISFESHLGCVLPKKVAAPYNYIPHNKRIQTHALEAMQYAAT